MVGWLRPTGGGWLGPGVEGKVWWVVGWLGPRGGALVGE